MIIQLLKGKIFLNQCPLFDFIGAVDTVYGLKYICDHIVDVSIVCQYAVAN